MATCPIFLLNPNLSTICLATRETCMKSFDAPVVTLSDPKITSSATLNEQGEWGIRYQAMCKEPGKNTQTRRPCSLHFPILSLSTYCSFLGKYELDVVSKLTKRGRKTHYLRTSRQMKEQANCQYVISTNISSTKQILWRIIWME